MPEPIEFWSDFISPYGYIAATQIDAVAARHGRTVRWRMVLLGVTVLKVMGLRPLPETPLKADYLRIDVPRLAGLYGVPLTTHTVPGVNPVRAARAFLWVSRQDEALGKEFSHRIYRRLWVRGADISPVGAVLEEAAALGLDRVALANWLASEEARAALKAEVDEAIALGVFGAPFFRVDGEPIWGADRLWMLEHRLRHGGWPPLALSSPDGCPADG